MICGFSGWSGSRFAALTAAGSATDYIGKNATNSPMMVKSKRNGTKK